MNVSFLRFLTVGCVAVSGLVSCRDVAVPNGEVPDQYLPAAQKYLGDYQGSMNGNKGTLRLSLQGKKVILSFTGANGTDLIDARCGSTIGDVTSVDVDQNGSDYVLKSAKVQFSANNCVSIEGKELTLNFRDRGSQLRIQISLLEGSKLEKECRMDSGNPAAGIPPREYCDWVQRNSYLKGEFNK